MRVYRSCCRWATNPAGEKEGAVKTRGPAEKDAPVFSGKCNSGVCIGKSKPSNCLWVPVLGGCARTSLLHLPFPSETWR